MTHNTHQYSRRPGAGRAAAPLLGVLALCAAAGPAAAQRLVSTLDVGGASVRSSETVAQTAATVNPSVRADWARGTLAAAGTASQFGTGMWSTQGGLDASLFTPAGGPLVGEVAASAGGSAHRDGTRTGQALGVGRAHVMGGRGGLWAGAGGGRTWSGGAWHGVRLAEGGAWARLGVATALASAAPTAVADSVRYTDATLAVRVDLARAEVSASAGVRGAARGLPTVGAGGARSWGGASATVWLARWLGVVASGGTYPVDPTQGFPGGRYATLGLRLGSHRASAVAADERPHAATRDGAGTGGRTAPQVLAFRVESAPGGPRTLRVRAPSATTVEVMGDFTEWLPVRLAPTGEGWWAAGLPVGQGTHQLNVRVNGGAWLVPPGLTSLSDEFGGIVGVLVIK